MAASGHVGGVHGTHGVMLVALAVMWGVKTGRERERTRPSKDERCKCAEMQACDVVILLTLLMREKWKAICCQITPPMQSCRVTQVVLNDLSIVHFPQ